MKGGGWGGEGWGEEGGRERDREAENVNANYIGGEGLTKHQLHLQHILH